MKAKIFISCGQNKERGEIEIAKDIAARLKRIKDPCCVDPDQGFECYVAISDQSLVGLRENIFRQLETSEYYLFIDFKREVIDAHDEVGRGSLFTNQELAVASYLEKDAILFQETGVIPREGMLSCIQGNVTKFDDRNQLAAIVEREVQDRVNRGEWSVRWKSALKVEMPETRFYGLAKTRDSIDPSIVREWFYFHLKVRNQHRSKIALSCSLILENVVAVEGANAKVKFFEPVELKWAGASLGLPAVHIPPSQARRFDAFRIPARPPYSVHFSTLTDSTEFWPELSVPGAYLLSYSVVSQNLGFARGALKIGVPESGADGLKVGLADADGR